MEDVGGYPPSLSNKGDADRVLTAYKALVERGVLHGDLKKSNIRIIGDKVVFLDFGVSNVDKLLALLKLAKGSKYKINHEKLLSRLEDDIKMVAKTGELNTKHTPLLREAYRRIPTSLQSLQAGPDTKAHQIAIQDPNLLIRTNYLGSRISNLEKDLIGSHRDMIRIRHNDPADQYIYIFTYIKYSRER